MPSQAKLQWYVIDAANKRVGRLASRVAFILQGKHKATYAPNVLDNDYLIIINAEKVVFTGKKMEQKIYHRHSGFFGGLKERKASQVLQEHPERILTSAIKCMLPKSKLGHRMMTKVRIYAGTAHPHISQNPTPLSV